MEDFHRLQFNLLGNEFEALFLPSAVIVVEGKTDKKYIEKIASLHFSERRIVVVNSNGDPKRKVHSVKETVGNFELSPYKNRTIVVLDSTHQPGLRAELKKMGIEDANIVVWNKNGIEYLYPTEIVAEIFACPEDQVAQLKIEGDEIVIGKIRRKKDSLCDEVVLKLKEDSPLPNELNEKLNYRISEVIGS
jgi:hypothetical protein